MYDTIDFAAPVHVMRAVRASAAAVATPVTESWRAKILNSEPFDPDEVRQLAGAGPRAEPFVGAAGVSWARRTVASMDAEHRTGQPTRFALAASSMPARFIGSRADAELAAEERNLAASVRQLRSQANLTIDTDERDHLQSLAASGARELAAVRLELNRRRGSRSA